eukprot:1156100-Pelagomonas_calceolata.AAC.2
MIFEHLLEPIEPLPDNARFLMVSHKYRTAKKPAGYSSLKKGLLVKLPSVWSKEQCSHGPL